MTLLLPFFLGFCIAFLAVLLPGLINMTGAKISIQEGKNEAISFVAGATSIVFLQTFFAVLCARFISSHVEIVSFIQELGIVIFSSLSIYFFMMAKKPNKTKPTYKIKGKSNRFFYGVLLSTLNFLPIPFYVFASMSLVSAGYFQFLQFQVLSFVFGVVFGSFTVFYLYIVAFKRIENKTDFLSKNINRIIGLVTAIMALFTLYKFIG